MFTGIIEATGVVLDIRKKTKGRAWRLQIRAPKKFATRRLGIGSSIAVDGVCLTLVQRKASVLSFDVVGETIRRSVLGRLKKGDPVNLERPVRYGDRMEGHFVLGHVDGIGRVRRLIQKGKSRSLLIACERGLVPYLVEKGSITVNGVSLTLGKIEKNSFWMHLIPHTLWATNLQFLKAGSTVNLEGDILTKLAMKLLVDNPKRPV